MPSVPEIHRTIHTVFRMESPRLIAGLARMVRDVGRAEEPSTAPLDHADQRAQVGERVELSLAGEEETRPAIE